MLNLEPLRRLSPARLAAALLVVGVLAALLALLPSGLSRPALGIVSAAALAGAAFVVVRSRPPAAHSRPSPLPSPVHVEEWVNVKAADGIGYLEERPAWFVRVVHPARFKEVEHDTHFKVFLFPTSALVAVLLRFFDNPDNPYCFHRVFDLADPPTREYLKRLEVERRWVVVVNSRGTEEGFSREIPIDPDGLPKGLRDGEAHLTRLGQRDGKSAVDDFLRVFKAEGEKGGFQAGWRAVDEWLKKRA